MGEYRSGPPQSPLHGLLLDAADTYYAAEAKFAALAIKTQIPEGTPIPRRSTHFPFEHDGKTIYVSADFSQTRAAFDKDPNKPERYTGIGYTMQGDKFQVKFTPVGKTKSDWRGEPVRDVEITDLHKRTDTPDEMIERIQEIGLPRFLNCVPCDIENGKVVLDSNIYFSDKPGTAYSVSANGWNKNVIAAFPDKNSDLDFRYDIIAENTGAKAIRLHAANVQELKKLRDRVVEMENKYMSTMERNQERNQDRTTDAKKEKPKIFFARIVADKLAEQLADGKAPMQRNNVQSLPYNPCTGNPYSGINGLHLMMDNRRDPRWMSFNEAKDAGYKVKEGEKATPIQFWPKKQPGQENKSEKEKPQMQTTWLFNADQLQFIPPMKKEPVRPDPYDRVSDILKNCGATVVHDQKERSFYNASRDEIHLPKPDSYKNLDNYCQDALNAYFHSTGHPSRLDRDTFDSPKVYEQEREELLCAVSTTMMCAELGIPSDATKNAELTTKWADSLKDYPIQFSQAMKESEKAITSTLRQEQIRNIELNPQNNEVWRSVEEASPAIAVKTLLTHREVLQLADKEPEKLNTFDHDGKEIFTVPGTGNLVSKKEVDTPGKDGVTYEMAVKTDGYDRDGNTYKVVIEATVRKNESGLTETVKPPEARSVDLNNREMALPLDWSGNVVVSPCHEDENGTLHQGRSEDYPEFYGAFAERENGEDMLLASFEREKQAQYYASLVERQMKYQQERPQSQQQTTQAAPEKGQEVAAEQQSSQAKPPVQEQEASPQTPEQAESRETEQQERPASQQEQEAQSEREQVEEIASERDEPAPEQPAHEQDKEQAREEAKEKIAERLTEEKMDADKAAKRVAAMAKRFEVPKEPTPYMQTKGVGLMPGTYQNKTSTCIPLYNVDGELRSMAYADKDGKKNFAKGTDRSGCAFYDKKAVEKSNVVGFSVGAATAATVSQVFKGVPVVATMDAANLPVVVAAFKEKYPDKQPVIFANNNQAYEAEKGRNPGKYYAEQAAKKTGALVVSPRFAADEKSNGFVDFNDLATKSKFGKEAVKDQCEPALEKAKVMAAEQAKKKEQEKERGNKELARG